MRHTWKYKIHCATNKLWNGVRKLDMAMFYKSMEHNGLKYKVTRRVSKALSITRQVAFKLQTITWNYWYKSITKTSVAK